MKGIVFHSNPLPYGEGIYFINMAKIKSKYVCQKCGYETAGYLGKCPECSSWGSFIEEVENVSLKNEPVMEIVDSIPLMKLSEIEMPLPNC